MMKRCAAQAVDRACNSNLLVVQAGFAYVNTSHNQCTHMSHMATENETSFLELSLH